MPGKSQNSYFCGFSGRHGSKKCGGRIVRYMLSSGLEAEDKAAAEIYAGICFWLIGKRERADDRFRFLRTAFPDWEARGYVVRGLCR